MTVPLGNTPSGGANAPDELKTPGLVWMGNAVARNEPPVIVFYRTVEFPPQFAPNPMNIDPATARPKLVDPVTVDLYFPNGPLAGRVYRRIGFINSGITGAVRRTALGSINVGQLGVGKGANGDYPQLNALDSDALDWASKVHQAAGGDVFAFYGGEPSAPVAAPAPEAAPADRFAGMPVPGTAPAQPAAPAGMPGMGAPAGPPPGFAAPAAAPAPQGPPPGMGQPGPVAGPPPNGVPNLGQQTPAGPPPGMPGWAQGQA